MSLKKLFLSCFAIVALSAKAQVNPTVQWVNYLSQDPVISAISSGLDGNSNVYTSGRIYPSPGNADIVVQCADSTGAIQWTYNYDNGGYDSPHCMSSN
ncbi:MAG: hypothetical protein MUF75_04755 [Bacteroidia bacterium]|jgi:hypothetical protein|nr:hypothetical protein [Bacteroidia bacterium]